MWIWVGALKPEFYPEEAQNAMRTLIEHLGTGGWGAGVWFGNTLQYFLIQWVGTALLQDPDADAASLPFQPTLEYYAVRFRFLVP